MWSLAAAITAVDVARSAVRLGAKDVNILYRREKKDMPAERQEILDAIEEGVKVISLAAPVRLMAREAGVHRLHP